MATYQEICRQVENLTLDEQIRLMEELAKIVRHRTQAKPKRSIMELEGSVFGQVFFRIDRQLKT